MDKLLYQIKLTDETITQIFEKKLGISLTRYQILQVLLKETSCNQYFLQEALQIDKAAITRHLKILEESGYISRERNPDNQRQVLVSLTYQAKVELTQSPKEGHREICQAMDDILSAEEATLLRALLVKLEKGLLSLPL